MLQKLLNFAIEMLTNVNKRKTDMKKVMMIILMAVVLAMPSQAQVKFGLKGGLNLTHMSFDKSVSNVSNQAGFFVGPTIKLTVPVVGLSFDAAALYDQRSAKAKDADMTLKSQSLQIPINVRYGVGLGSIVNLFAFAGPQFGFNIGDKHQTIIKDAAEWTLRSSNVSANFGIGATVLNHFQVTVNYNIPLGKTGEVNEWDVAKSAWRTINDGKANAWQISAGYFF